MFTRLERYAYAPMAVLVLWAVLLLAAWPAAADAQETPRAKDPQGSNRDARAAGYVVVASGDSLWSISEGQLGPGAAPQRIARGAERIHALNRDRIGTDPNTIVVGQKLVLPSAVERRTRRQAPEPARAEPVRGTAAAASLPGGVAVAPVPVVRSLAADGTPRSPVAHLSGTRAVISSAASALVEFADVEDRYAGRRLLGGALILTSLGTGAFPVVSAMVRAARRARVRRAYKESLYRSAGAAYAAAPFGGSTNAHTEERLGAPTSAAPKERERPADPPNPGNGRDALEEARRGARVAQMANGNRAGLRRAGSRGSTRRRPPRGTRVSAVRQVQAKGSQRRRVNGRRKMVGDNPKTPDARRGWVISESLRRSLEGFPLQPGAPMDRALAELRPQIVDELRSVAVLKRRRRLSDLEHRQVSALQDLVALAPEENPNGERPV